jgi:hypothetical protein
LHEFVLKGHGFSRAAKEAIELRALAPEGCFSDALIGVDATNSKKESLFREFWNYDCPSANSVDRRVADL